MIIEFFLVALVALKALGFIELSWTTTCVVALALVAVGIQMHLNKKASLDGLLRGAKVLDDKLDEFEFRLDSIEEGAFDRDESNR